MERLKNSRQNGLAAAFRRVLAANVDREELFFNQLQSVERNISYI